MISRSPYSQWEREMKWPKALTLRQERGKKRVLSLDLLRGGTVLYMEVTHTWANGHFDIEDAADNFLPLVIPFAPLALFMCWKGIFCLISGCVLGYRIVSGIQAQWITGTRLGDKVYVFGGCSSGSIFRDSFIVYTISTGRWRQMDKSSVWPCGRNACSQFALGGLLHIVGGSSSDRVLQDHWCYDPTTKEWTQMAATPLAFSSAAVAVAGDTVHFIGGHPNWSLHITFSLRSGWNLQDSVPFQCSGSAAVAHGLDVHVIGGTYHGKQSHIYSTRTRQWRMGGRLPVSFQSGRACLYGPNMVAVSSEQDLLLGCPIDEPSDEGLFEVAETRESQIPDTVLEAAPQGVLAASLSDSEFHESHSFKALYELGPFLGKGVFGSVYQANDIRTRETVAVKFQYICGITRRPNWDPRTTMTDAEYEVFLQTHEGIEFRFRQRNLRRELAVAQSHPIDSPYVIKILRHFRNTDTLNQMVIVMEFVKGENLQTYIDRHMTRSPTQPVPELLSIMHQLTLALVDLKEAGIIHRDIKPDNIMVDDAGNVKLVDLGLSKMVDSTNPLTHSLGVGNMLYRAPECWDGGGAYLKNSLGDPMADIGNSQDVWSIGLIFSQLVHHRWVMSPLISRPTLQPLIEALSPSNPYRFDTVTARHTGSQELADIINSMLQKSPTHRIPVHSLARRMHELVSSPIEELALYRLEQFVGSSGFGMVFQATEYASGMIVAVKFQRICDISTKRDWDPRTTMTAEEFEEFQETLEGIEFLQRQRNLRRELAVAQYHPINSPYVIKILRHFRNTDTPNQMVIVMEFVKGENLQEYIDRNMNRGPDQPVPYLLSIMHQLSLALVALNEAGVIHRDIRPDNIMVDDAGNVKLVNLGLCKLVDSTNPLTNSIGVGNRLYMAPECWAKNSVGLPMAPIGNSADVWSVGLIFSQLVHHQWVMAPLLLRCSDLDDTLPFLDALEPGNPYRFDTLTAAQTGSQGLAELINSMLQKNPAERATAQEVATRMQELMDDAPPDPVFVPPPKNMRALEMMGRGKTTVRGRFQ
ncbi:hypothetical protein KIPB_000578 [Kipferlia bialata]|uniref:Protein kinase domain-containing protein n=1 Tax=Kipferlia bialata TaxID=797122 RepID=A0A9K3GES6_9EUKA|nr:hypothetical protein KIPB_000578 [Kipferlia bialata]|eukprot:g578.t1